ncbi:MAG TPA: hypothetical protein PLC98_25070 [Anaerolineales bacterium]|nr:hypothetical protein [Anaerolineales bacterium]
MPTLYVREIPDHLYRQAQQIAVSEGRSLSSYIVTVLEQAVEDAKVRQRRVKILASARRRRRPLPKGAPDSTSLLRQIRGEHE